MARRGENIYKRKDGRYEGRYVIGKTQGGKTRFGYVYARQFSDVRKLLLDKKVEQSRSMDNRASKRITLEKWIGYWMENDLLGSVKESSYQVYRRQINRHLLPALGRFELAELSPGIIYEFVRNLESSGMAASTARGVYRLLAASMRFAQDEGIIIKNPCRKIRVQGPVCVEQRVLSRQEQEMIHALPEAQEDFPTMLGLYTGMRLGEICALKWSDIDWERRTITVRRTVQRVARVHADSACKTFLLIGTPKSRRSQRVLPVPTFLLEKLRIAYAPFGSSAVFSTG